MVWWLAATVLFPTSGLGYGLIADAATCMTPLLYTLRAGFPEDAVLAAWLAERPGMCRVEPERLASGGWLDALAVKYAVELQGITHVALLCPDIMAAKPRLEAAGIPLSGGPVRFSAEAQAIFVRDPDRNVIELHQRG